MQQVGIGRERRFAALVLGDRNLILLGKGDELFARAKIPFAPRRDDFYVRLERVVGKLEPHLIVALAGGAMGDRVGADLFGDLDLRLGDQRARDRSAEQILPFVQRIGAEHRKHIVAHEFFAQILDEDVLRLDTERERLGARRLEFFALAKIGRKGHDLAAVGGLQPLEDDRRIESARIGEHDLFHFAFWHSRKIPRASRRLARNSRGL